MELEDWLEYAYMQDENNAKLITYAVIKAFVRQSSKEDHLDGEVPIDTTAPDFAQNFKGFINIPPETQQRMPDRPTDIIIG